MKNVAQKVTKSLKHVYQRDRRRVGKQNAFVSDIAFESAWSQFCAVDAAERDSYLLNTVMTLCLHFKREDKVMDIWPDLERQMRIDDAVLSPLLMIKCFVRWPWKCILVLEWMQWTTAHCWISNKEKRAFCRILSMVLCHCTSRSQIDRIECLLSGGALSDLQLNEDMFVQTAMMNAFSKQKASDSAFRIFRSIGIAKADSVAMSCLMKAFIDEMRHRDALNIYSQKCKYHEQIGDVLDDDTHSLAIKCCLKLNDYETGKGIHDSLRRNTNRNRSLSNRLHRELIRMYCHFGDILTAKELFDSLPSIENGDGDIGALIVMMKGLVDHHMMEDVMTLYHDERYHSVIAVDDRLRFLVLKAAALESPAAHRQTVEEMHSEIRSGGDIRSKTQLIEHYGNCGDSEFVERAQTVFESITETERDSMSLNAMIRCLWNHGMNEEALGLYRENESLHDDVMHLSMIKWCINRGHKMSGKQIIDSLLSRENALSSTTHSINLYNVILDFYAKFKETESALKLFAAMKAAMMVDAVTVTTAMRMYIEHNAFDQALSVFDEYCSVDGVDNHSHDALALKACVKSGDLERGRSIISRAKEKRHGLNQCRNEWNNSLITFYANFGDLESAQRIFNEMKDSLKTTTTTMTPKMDAVTVSSMMSGYIDHGLNERALELYHEFKAQLQREEAIHALAIKAYGAMGEVASAEKIFSQKVCEEMKSKVSIHTMMNMYCDREMNMECIAIFDRFYTEIGKERKSYIVTLRACTQGTLLFVGRRIHGILRKEENMDLMMNEVSIQIALIEMYGKCGELEECMEIFEDSKHRGDIALLNAMINAFGRNGNIEAMERVYYDFVAPRLSEKVDRQTFIYLFNGYSHSQRGEEAERIWRDEIMDDEVRYNEYVVACLVDCLCRCGRVERAYDLYLEYRAHRHHRDEWNENDRILLLSLLNGCRSHGHCDLAQIVYAEIQQRLSV